MLEQNGQVEISPAGVEVHVLDADDVGAEPELVPHVHDNDDGRGGVVQEEILDVGGDRVLAVVDGPRADPELGAQDEDVKEEADPGAQDAGLRAEGEFVEGPAAHGPCFAEADVGEADGGPGEQRREGGDGEQPVEDRFFLLDVGEIGEEAEHAGANDGHERAASAVDVGEPTRGLALVGKSGDGAAGAEDGRVAHGHDGNEDDAVHDAGKDLDARVLDGDDEGAGAGIS